MTTTTDFLDLVARADRALRLPPVADLYCPPGRGLGRDAEFLALQLADGSTGMAYTLLGDTLERLLASDLKAYVGRAPLELARGYADRDPVARALGLAAYNAVSHHVFRRAGYRPETASDSLGAFGLDPGDHLGMIGFFRVLVPRVRAAGARLTVLELRPELVETTADYEVTLDPAKLAACTKIVATSSVLLNDTLDAVLAHGGHAREFALIGPSASGFPDPLFARGVTVAGGYRVDDPAALLRRARALEPWGDAGAKCAIRRDAYPGFEALVARAATSPPPP
jgi:uncharacterized protein (DUF4213/DUF364 family)